MPQEQPTVINTCQPTRQSFSKWLFTLNLSFNFFQHWPVHLLIFDSIRNSFEYFILLGTSEEYIGTPTNGIWNWCSRLIYFNNSLLLSHSTFPSSFTLDLSSSSIFCYHPFLSIPVVEISRKKKRSLYMDGENHYVLLPCKLPHTSDL